MSLELYSLIPGQQVKRDRDLSNVTIQCDPRAVYPDNESSVNNRFRKREAGKIAVEDDICNLNVANLTVNGQLKLNGEIAAEICNIFCPEDFNLRANSSILQDAGDTFVVTAVNAVDLSTAVGGSGNINIGAAGDIRITADDLAVIRSNTDNIIVDAGGTTTITAGTSNVVVNAGSNFTLLGTNNNDVIVTAGTNIAVIADTGDIDITAPNGSTTISGNTATNVGAATGRLGFYGKAPISQQAAPVTLADVIALLGSGATGLGLTL